MAGCGQDVKATYNGKISDSNYIFKPFQNLFTCAAKATTDDDTPRLSHI